MPIETYQDPSTGLIIQRVVGRLAERELIAMQRRLYVEERIDPGAPVLWDTRASQADRSFARAVDLVARDHELSTSMAGGKTAIVAGPAASIQPIAGKHPRETRMFTDFREAVNWLLGTSIGPADTR